MGSFLEESQEVYKHSQKIDATFTGDLISNKDPKIQREVENILKKYSDKLCQDMLTQSEKGTMEQYLIILNETLKNDCTMAKVIPQSDIRDFLLLKRDLKGFFARHADINKLLTKSNNYYNTIYDCLRLDYDGTKYDITNDDYMGLIIVRIPNFALRVPLRKTYIDQLRNDLKRYIIREDGSPFSGIGFTANIQGIPEFYVSITNHNEDNNNGFPIFAFSAKLNLIQHNTDIIDFATYDCGDSDTSADEHFVIIDSHTNINIAKNYHWDL